VPETAPPPHPFVPETAPSPHPFVPETAPSTHPFVPETAPSFHSIVPATFRYAQNEQLSAYLGGDKSMWEEDLLGEEEQDNEWSEHKMGVDDGENNEEEKKDSQIEENKERTQLKSDHAGSFFDNSSCSSLGFQESSSSDKSAYSKPSENKYASSCNKYLNDLHGRKQQLLDKNSKVVEYDYGSSHESFRNHLRVGLT
jgi:hypothetical protein